MTAAPISPCLTVGQREREDTSGHNYVEPAVRQACELAAGLHTSGGNLWRDTIGHDPVKVNTYAVPHVPAAGAGGIDMHTLIGAVIPDQKMAGTDFTHSRGHCCC